MDSLPCKRLAATICLPISVAPQQASEKEQKRDVFRREEGGVFLEGASQYTRAMRLPRDFLVFRPLVRASVTDSGNLPARAAETELNTVNQSGQRAPSSIPLGVCDPRRARRVRTRILGVFAVSRAAKMRIRPPRPRRTKHLFLYGPWAAEGPVSSNSVIRDRGRPCLRPHKPPLLTSAPKPGCSPCPPRSPRRASSPPPRAPWPPAARRRCGPTPSGSGSATGASSPAGRRSRRAA